MLKIVDKFPSRRKIFYLNNKLKSELDLVKKERPDKSDDDFGSFFGGAMSVLAGSWIYKNKVKNN